MTKGDTVEFHYYIKNYDMKLRGEYMGDNGVAHIVKRENVYYWLKK